MTAAFSVVAALSFISFAAFSLAMAVARMSASSSRASRYSHAVSINSTAAIIAAARQNPVLSSGMALSLPTAARPHVQMDKAAFGVNADTGKTHAVRQGDEFFLIVNGHHAVKGKFQML